MELTTILPNGTGLDTLTSNAVENAEPTFFADAIEPEWSPNGRKIVFNSDRAGGDDEIWTMTSSGGSLDMVTDNGISDDAPDWGIATN